MARQMYYALIVAGFVLLAGLIYIDLPASIQSNTNPNASASSTVELKGRTIQVTVADEPDERALGLSGRQSLAPDEGMLFVFEEEEMYAFWMKDMNFPIDILWISSGEVIVDIREHVSPASYPATFEPRGVARYVLELPGGWVEEHDVKIGDVVRL